VATLYIRNVPDAVVETLKQRAAAQGRSLNAEALALLGGAAGERIGVDEVLERIRANAASPSVDVDAVELVAEGRRGRTERLLGA
jgi:hypothetical protein